MPVPQRRNQKKHRQRPRSTARANQPYRDVPLLRGDENGRPGVDETCGGELASLSFEERLMLIRQPGDWLTQVPQMPTFGEMLLGEGRGSFLDRDNDNDDDDSDFDDDMADFYEE